MQWVMGPVTDTEVCMEGSSEAEGRACCQMLLILREVGHVRESELGERNVCQGVPSCDWDLRGS